MTYNTGPICLDELVTVLGQFPTDFCWNGWLIPHIDPVAVEAVMAALATDELCEQAPTHEWLPDGSLVVTEWDGDDAYPETLTPDEDGLYALGAYAWTWAPDPDALLGVVS